MDFSNQSKLYYKVFYIIVKQIIKEEIKPGDKITSVREQAKSNTINPQTVQKAYNILIEEEVLIAKVGSGNYLTTNIDKIKKLKDEFINYEINSFMNVVKEYNIDKELIINKLKEKDE